MKIENITVSDWRDYERHDFSFNSHDGLIVLPKTPAEGNPWVWRAEFFSAFDTVDMDLLSKGWAIAYYSVSDMYGAPGAIALMKPFKDALVEKYSLSAKCAMFGFSRGGLYTVNYTAEYPEDIAVIYLDAPVCDIRSWPGNFGKGGGDDFCWKECKEHYGITDESAKTFSGNPLDKIEKLVADKIPCVLVAGLIDRLVPYCENGELFVKKYEELGGTIKTILKPDCDHHPHSLDDPTPISEFIIVHK
ncbi:MAG: alpha/beta hydrolase [Clostridia bacterium]|nr:alpha/beta hydrolase [Clostridia bacterium]